MEKNATEVVAALIRDGDRFMICQRPAHKARGLLWEFVGGKVEPGETGEQALVRECREELAVTVSVGEAFMEVEHQYPDLHVHLTLFNAGIQEGTPQMLEHNDIRWITPEEIPQYEFCPADKAILKRLQHESANRQQGGLRPRFGNGCISKEEVAMNIPKVQLGLVAVSRSAFPRALAERRRSAVAEEAARRGLELYPCPVTVETERDMLCAVDDLRKNGVNALVVFLGNFGPETPETLLAQKFDGPVMFCAAAEESLQVLKADRGDAYCGMLNCAYNMALRNVRGYIPPYPVGDAAAIVKMIEQFIPVARALIGVKSLKIITFGPRPEEFFACNAPIQPLYELGVEISENSELDLLKAFEAHENDPRIAQVLDEMCRELNIGEPKARMDKMAQYEVTLLDLAEQLKGSRDYVAFANRCWPAYKDYFGFFPCYVNSRLTARGIPVACEVDVYGALSEYIGACIVEDAVTLLDINNSVPAEQYNGCIRGTYDYRAEEIFMGFHCGNTPSGKLVRPNLSYHVILGRDLADKGPCMGTMEGDLIPGGMTLFRLHSTADCRLTAYVAQGEVLPVPAQSFGSIGIIAIPEMARFYRNVLLEKHFPHHGAVAFEKIGSTLWEVFRLLGVADVSFNQPKGMLYPTENPFH